MTKIEHQPLSDRAYHEILKGMTNGIFAPMQPLVIRTLAETYGISVTPIREALQRLVAERLLVVLPNRSIVVPLMTQERFNQLLPVRVALEGMAAELATPNLGPQDFVRLHKLLDRIAETAAGYDSRTYLKLNREFHFTIYEKARNPELMHVILGLWLRVGPVFTGLFDDDHYRQHANDEHRHIVAAMERGDPRAARDSIARDLTLAAQALMPRLLRTAAD
ncbi:GntR family transcriptional regulator [Rhodobacter sp. Har01]|uniref:GntR family transcriptional regulator n=1 Tax=Rhodobacter sp. Har01 TaxID=2883999 RepID=UPI001D079065|nr:GntR family transcriptional regulator [Rhodobacter sp. Har01]MCB6179939.1 GntR family transcriptional regulator [Rhodobacter sp. Har01]